MLNSKELYEFRTLRGLTFREVANYCSVSHTMISEVEKGEKGLTKETHDEIVNGINLAYKAKMDGTLQAKNTRKPAEIKSEYIEKKVEVPKNDTKKRANSAKRFF